MKCPKCGNEGGFGVASLQGFYLFTKTSEQTDETFHFIGCLRCCYFDEVGGGSFADPALENIEYSVYTEMEK